MRQHVLAVLVAASLGGCGVTAEKAAHRVDDEKVPFDLLRASTSTSSTTSPAADGVDIEIHLVSQGALVPVARRLRAPASLRDVLRVLGQGPTPSERQAGLTTSVPVSASFVDVDARDGVATVELGNAFVALAAEEQRVALAQMVYALTARPNVNSVAFTVGGQPAEVPRGDGSLTAGSVTRADYPNAGSE